MPRCRIAISRQKNGLQFSVISAKMAHSFQTLISKRQFVTPENLPKCHAPHFNRDNMGISEIGTKIANDYVYKVVFFAISLETNRRQTRLHLQFSRQTQGGIQRHGTCTPWR